MTVAMGNELHFYASNRFLDFVRADIILQTCSASYIAASSAMVGPVGAGSIKASVRALLMAFANFRCDLADRWDFRLGIILPVSERNIFKVATARKSTSTRPAAFLRTICFLLRERVDPNAPIISFPRLANGVSDDKPVPTFLVPTLPTPPKFPPRLRRKSALRDIVCSSTRSHSAAELADSFTNSWAVPEASDSHTLRVATGRVFSATSDGTSRRKCFRTSSGNRGNRRISNYIHDKPPK